MFYLRFKNEASDIVHGIGASSEAPSSKMLQKSHPQPLIPLTPQPDPSLNHHPTVPALPAEAWAGKQPLMLTWKNA